MNNNLESKTKLCPFKTVRTQCLLRKNEKEPETFEQNFQCNHEGDYEGCKTYKDYRKSQGK